MPQNDAKHYVWIIFSAFLKAKFNPFAIQLHHA